jgi:hypothetical protein
MRPSDLCLLAALGLACDATAQAATEDTRAAETTPAPVDFHLPPEGHAAMTPWLAAGHYRSWHCEPAPHATRPPGAHGRTRICSNDALSNASGDGAYPVGAAAVKELWRAGGDGADGAIQGYAVYRKVAAGGGAASWYWYEIERGSLYADGRGDSGAARDLCVSCHEDAPRDHVFTHVK